MSTDMTAASDGELKAAQAAIQREVQRRETLSRAEQEARFQQEMQEVRSGQRAPFDEHIAALSPKETLALLEAGNLTHLGLDKSKRRGVQ